MRKWLAHYSLGVFYPLDAKFGMFIKVRQRILEVFAQEFTSVTPFVDQIELCYFRRYEIVGINYIPRVLEGHKISLDLGGGHSVLF